MNETRKGSPRRFHAHETARAQALNGLPLATAWQRIGGYFIDLLLALILWTPFKVAWRYYVLHQEHIHIDWDFHEAGNIVAMLLYWGASNYFAMAERPENGAFEREPYRSPASAWAPGNPSSGAWDTVPPCLRAASASSSSSGTATACAPRTASPKPSSSI